MGYESLLVIINGDTVLHVVNEAAQLSDEQRSDLYNSCLNSNGRDALAIAVALNKRYSIEPFEMTMQYTKDQPFERRLQLLLEHARARVQLNLSRNEIDIIEKSVDAPISDRIELVEAILRWDSPKGGPVRRQVQLSLQKMVNVTGLCKCKIQKELQTAFEQWMVNDACA